MKIDTEYHEAGNMLAGRAPLWSAVRRDYEEEGPVGWGFTEAEAIEDMKAQIEEGRAG